MMKSELAEITNAGLPPADIEALKQLRNEACESTQQSSFTLQSQQRFLRRILSPDSPVRNLLMIHGTGTGKTCTAIQIAEEYILRPEFQDQKVLVIASSAVQDNFRTQLFDMQRVSLDTTAGILESKQCTGRRYLDMLLRIEAEPRNWSNPDVRDRLQLIAKKIVREFYEFNTYESFGEELMQHIGVTEKDVDHEWIHKNFDNRLLIIDEAHNIRESKDTAGTIKGITRGMEKLVQIADGLVLVLLTATPMYDTYDEIVFYMNLFLWNDRKQPFTKSLKASDFFHSDATIKEGQSEQAFRDWCQNYVSYVKGDNPFTFPFRLPPPRTVSQNLTKSFTGRAIGDQDRLRYISLVDSQAQGHQLAELTRTEGEDNEDRRRAIMQTTVAVLPGNKSFSETFRFVENAYQYTGTPCLTPAELPNVSAKFAKIIDILSHSQGIVLVYSNYVELGARLFSMALEEHGYTSAVNKPFLAQSSYTGPSKGKYITLTSDFSATELNQMIAKAKSPQNRKGDLIKVIVASPVVSEGVDFRNVRQVHILDPWWNMSRIEQVIGRGLRTCSHKQLDFQDQNCTVYLHVVRTQDGRECFDEYTYRTRVVPKAIRIAKVRKLMAESAIDCPLQNQINTLPEQWKALPIEQRWAEGNQTESFSLGSMMAPMFDDSPDVLGCMEPISHHYRKEDGDVRPLSTYLDVRDEFLTKLAKLLVDKPIWDREDLIAALRPYTQEVVIYNLQQAITSAFKFKDAFGRASVLESKGDFYALSPIGLPSGTVVERTTQPPARGRVSITETKEEAKQEPLPELEASILTEKRTAFKWPADATTRFSEQTLNGYIFDHVFTETERRAYLRTNPTNLPFVDRLRISESPDVYVLGKDVFEPATVDMVGDLNTAYREWTDRLLAKFITRKADLFASLSGSKFTIVRYEEKGDQLVREKQQKRFEPTICGTGFYDKEATLKLSQFIDERGVGTPRSVGTKNMNKEDICVYTELLAREEHNIFWLTPEELAVLYDGKGTKQNPSNQDRFTAEFKK
jgi:superfamily II DNA or RNA helicase